MSRLEKRKKLERIAGLIGDLHAYGGALVVSIGASLYSPPAGLIVFGIFLTGIGLFYRGGSSSDS